MRKATAVLLIATLLLNNPCHANAVVTAPASTFPLGKVLKGVASLLRKKPGVTLKGAGDAAAFAVKHPWLTAILVPTAIAGATLLSANKIHEKNKGNPPKQQGGGGAATGTPDPNDRDGKPARVIQRGGNTLSNKSANTLNENFDTNLERREWGRALEELKSDNGIANDDHGVIMSNGDFYNTAGSYVDNLGSYVH